MVFFTVSSMGSDNTAIVIRLRPSLLHCTSNFPLHLGNRMRIHAHITECSWDDLLLLQDSKGWVAWVLPLMYQGQDQWVDTHAGLLLAAVLQDLFMKSLNSSHLFICGRPWPMTFPDRGRIYLQGSITHTYCVVVLDYLWSVLRFGLLSRCGLICDILRLIHNRELRLISQSELLLLSVYFLAAKASSLASLRELEWTFSHLFFYITPWEVIPSYLT